MTVYYYVPEQDRPSWGSGIIYYHVWLLVKNNIKAFVLHDTNPYKLKWLKLDVPICYVNSKGLNIKKDDVLVIPEFYADLPQLSKFKCRKIVFVQNAYYIFDGLKKVNSYEELDIRQVLYIMPHLKNILTQITTLPLYEMPPFIAPYFYKETDLHQRSRKILLYPKFNNRDYDILKRMMKDKLALEEKNTLQKIFSHRAGWQLVEIKKSTHLEVAEAMKEAAFFISLNTTEAFNSAVPEAMAAGCINICYEGVGPADFLSDNKNAYVFSNNHIYPLINRIIELVTGYDSLQRELQLIRMEARQTAEKYTMDLLEKKLLNFFSFQN